MYSFSHSTYITSHLLCAKQSSNFWDTNEAGMVVFLLGGGKDKPVNKPVLLNKVCVRACVLKCVLISASPADWPCCCMLACCGTCWLSVSSLFQTSFSRGFTKNMKLEAVNPRNPGELCVASVVSVKGRLMWLHLEGTHS